MCDSQHQGHDTVFFGNLLPDIDGIKTKLLEMKKSIEIFKNKINEIIEQLNNLVKTMELYYEINNDILKNYKIKNKNYETLQNIKEINITTHLFEKINDMNKYQNFNDIIFNVIDIYNKIYVGEDNPEENTTVKKETSYLYNRPISMKRTEIILNQMKNSICKIKTENEENVGGIGIFTKILYKYEYIPVLIVNKNISNDKELQVEFYENNEKLLK